MLTDLFKNYFQTYFIFDYGVPIIYHYENRLTNQEETLYCVYFPDDCSLVQYGKDGDKIIREESFLCPQEFFFIMLDKKPSKFGQTYFMLKNQHIKDELYDINGAFDFDDEIFECENAPSLRTFCRKLHDLTFMYYYAPEDFDAMYSTNLKFVNFVHYKYILCAFWDKLDGNILHFRDLDGYNNTLDIRNDNVEKLNNIITVQLSSEQTYKDLKWWMMRKFMEDK